MAIRGAYATGGQVPPMTDAVGPNASPVDVTTSGAGMGNNYNSPNNKAADAGSPGGYGSSGSASSSKAGM